MFSKILLCLALEWHHSLGNEVEEKSWKAKKKKKKKKRKKNEECAVWKVHSLKVRLKQKSSLWLHFKICYRIDPFPSQMKEFWHGSKPWELCRLRTAGTDLWLMGGLAGQAAPWSHFLMPRRISVTSLWHLQSNLVLKASQQLQLIWFFGSLASPETNETWMPWQFPRYFQGAGVYQKQMVDNCCWQSIGLSTQLLVVVICLTHEKFGPTSELSFLSSKRSEVSIHSRAAGECIHIQRKYGSTEKQLSLMRMNEQLKFIISRVTKSYLTCQSLGCRSQRCCLDTRET